MFEVDASRMATWAARAEPATMNGLVSIKPPSTILELVDRFGGNRESYKSASYNEAQVRREFIDPFFQALGWDISNTRGYAEAYKEVVHEDSIRIGGKAKAPDYSFRIGGTRKFFLEAKSLSHMYDQAVAR